jgi:hypothetical protein
MYITDNDKLIDTNLETREECVLKLNIAKQRIQELIKRIDVKTCTKYNDYHNLKWQDIRHEIKHITESII